MGTALLTGNGLTPLAPPTPVDHVTAGAGGWRLTATRGRLLPVVEWGVYAAVWDLAALWVVVKVARDVSGVGALPITLGLAAVGLGIGFLVTRAFWRRLAYAVIPPPFAVVLDAPQVLRGRPLTLRLQMLLVRGQSGGSHAPRVSVVLFEECVFEDATERTTDRHEVREVPCGGTLDRCTAMVPADLPPSFRGANNQVLWCVRVRWGRRGVAHFPLPVALAETGPDAALALVPTTSALAAEPDAPLTLMRASDGTVAGLARATSGARLRLCWQVVGKGNSERGEVAALILPADIPSTGAAFTATLPVQPPAWRGTLLTVGWVVELVGSDGKLVKRQWVPDAC